MIKKSIRRFLLFYLLLSITIASSLTAVGNYLLNSSAINKHLDIQLTQLSQFLNALVTENPSSYSLHKIQKILNQTPKTKRTLKKTTIQQNKFRLQVWNADHQLILRSYHTTHRPLSNFKNGFITKDTGNNTWRVYTHYDPRLKFTFMVGELVNFRERLQKQITWNNILILLWIYPLLGLLIWLTVGQGLKSLKELTKHLSRRSPTDFSPINLKNVTDEIKPLITELNELFSRLQAEFLRNRRFASEAAHELRTPLAALKTLSQLAILSDTEEERKKVIADLLKGIDRCTHIVQQLLTLSRLGREETLNDVAPLNLQNIATEIIAQIAPLALKKHIDIELKPAVGNTIIVGNETSIGILISNIVDNAIRYTPEHGKITVEIMENAQDILLRATDTGSGIPEELHSRVFERFYRVLGNEATGSGLGLAIVKQIADLHHANIRLATPNDGQGLEINISFSKK